MARAKQTDRADARRRYRASVSAAEEGAEGDDVPEAARSERTAKSSGGQSTGGGGGTKRMGVSAAFRAAWSPPDVRRDLALIPRLVVDKAFFIPAAIIAVAGILLLTPLMADRWVLAFVSAVVFVPPYFQPPLIGALVAGFLATRASYVVGGLVGLVVVVMFALYVFVTPATGYGPSERAFAILQAASLELPLSILVAGFVAYYKRLLRLLAPPPNAQRK